MTGNIFASSSAEAKDDRGAADTMIMGPCWDIFKDLDFKDLDFRNLDFKDSDQHAAIERVKS
jgi:hypothetical protein